MARLASIGFELNAATANVETGIVSSPFSIQTTTVRSGTYALKKSTAIGFGEVDYQFASPAILGIVYYRIYFRFDATPTASTDFFYIADAVPGGNAMAGFRFNASGNAFQLADIGAGIQVGSDSSAISPNTWYRLELKVDTTTIGASVLTARLDGVQFATGTRDFTGAAGQLMIGLGVLSGSETTANYYYDDLAINNTTGSFQNSYPGSGKIIHLKPNAAGDVNAWSSGAGGTAGASNNYTRVNEVTPNDLTSYNTSATLNQEDLFNVTDSGIGASDTVNVVSVGARLTDNTNTATTTAVKLEIEKTASGTKTQSSAIVPNATANFFTNAQTAPHNYPITTYQDPDSSNWTKTTLDSMQIGYILTATGVNNMNVSTIWALVDYTPSTGPAVTGPFPTHLRV